MSKSSPVESRKAKQTRRRIAVKAYAAYLADGLKPAAAAQAVGIAHSTIWRWHKAWLEKGDDGLLPQTFNCGRSGGFEDLTEAERNRLRWHRLCKASLTLAINHWIEEKPPQLEPGTRAKLKEIKEYYARIRRPVVWPSSLRNAAKNSVQVGDKFRGKKHAQGNELVIRRDNTIELKDGTRSPMRTYSIFESDDMSINEPFRYQCPETGQWMTGRQSLFTLDVYSAAWLGLNTVGRARDAYRVEDIADHMLQIVLAHGLPDIWRLERGLWESSLIHGVKLPDGSRWGGLDALFHVVHAFSSRGKGLIESSFSPLQNRSAHESLSIGRYASEFEFQTKLKMRADAGDKKALEQLWTARECADAQWKFCCDMNATPKERRAFGRDTVTPSDLLATGKPTPCQESDLWRFCPVKKMLGVNKGRIVIGLQHYPLDFEFVIQGVMEGDPIFDHGYQLFVAFHPGRPQDGCHIFNAERGARNRYGFEYGQFLFVAPPCPVAPNATLRREEQKFLAKRAARAAVNNEFRAIKAAGKTDTRISHTQDSYGNSTRLESTSPGTLRHLTGADTSPSSRDVSAQPEHRESSRPGVADDARGPVPSNSQPPAAFHQRRTDAGALAADPLTPSYDDVDLAVLERKEAALRASGVTMYDRHGIPI
jgi:hypothetical protein